MGKESGFCWARGYAGGVEGVLAIVCPAAARLRPLGVGAYGAWGAGGEGREGLEGRAGRVGAARARGAGGEGRGG